MSARYKGSLASGWWEKWQTMGMLNVMLVWAKYISIPIQTDTSRGRRQEEWWIQYSEGEVSHYWWQIEGVSLLCSTAVLCPGLILPDSAGPHYDDDDCTGQSAVITGHRGDIWIHTNVLMPAPAMHRPSSNTFLSAHTVFWHFFYVFREKKIQRAFILVT